MSLGGSMTEICFCLWYYITPAQTIAGLAAREYLLEGAEEDKASVLHALSGRDYQLCQFVELPASLRRAHLRGVPYSAIHDLGVESIFANEFARIADRLPSSLKMPDEKLFFATPLFDFGSGYVPAEIGDGYVRER